jgi:hypothetical protein
LYPLGEIVRVCIESPPRSSMHFAIQTNAKEY